MLSGRDPAHHWSRPSRVAGPFWRAGRSGGGRAGGDPGAQRGAGHGVFHRSGGQAANYSREQVRRADLYAGIIGVPGRPPVRDEPGLSYAELEFATAGELGLPRLVFVLDENAVLQLPQVFLSDPEFGGAGRFRVPWCVSVLVPLLLVYSRSRAVVFPTSATLLVKGLRSERGGSTQRVHRRRQQGEPVENAARSAPHAGLRSAAGVRVLCGPCRRRGLLPGCGHGVAR